MDDHEARRRFAAARVARLATTRPDGTPHVVPVTFAVDGDCLVSQHFPFSVRNRRIPLADIRGIQVNAELDEEGNVTHHSLLLVRGHASTDRLIDNLPSAEQARALAQQIDLLVRGGPSHTR